MARNPRQNIYLTESASRDLALLMHRWSQQNGRPGGVSSTIARALHEAAQGAIHAN